ncbi:Uncharacterized protein M6B38_222955 [Iris pallida]|uniref:J domain-containing protein n=1 Tax=Iris pallida TaxID=29817 RepID=A0AAX6DX14_IRIPA|nr:Uncharacterized protein M6B38_222955 [Iris pallida]
MASGGGKSGDFYEVLGLKKDCSEIELRNAYKKLAMRWHPDRCSASGSIEEAKEKFQAVQEAYSVLSDSNKRFLYDAGIHDIDDDENSFGDFLGEMAQMMSQTKPTQENGSHETFEELQQLFVDMFQDDLDHGFGDPISSYAPNGCDWFSAAASSGQPYCNHNTSSNKRGNSTMNSGKSGFGDFISVSGGFSSGSNDSGQSSGGRGGNNSNRRNGRKQKISSKHDVSSRDAKISA